MFFSSWSDIARVVIVAIVVFVFVVAMLRVVGQQALAKMSGYDMIVTVSLGSIIGMVILTRELTVSDAIAALLTLIVLQELTRKLQSRWLAVHHAVRETPRVLLWDGHMLEERLREADVSADEIRAAVRKMGLSSLSEVQIVVLENDGQWSVVPKSDRPSDDSAFHGLPIPGRPDAGRARSGDRAVPASPTRVP